VIASSEHKAGFLRFLHEISEPAGGSARRISEASLDGRRLAMNHSIYSADRSTHLKIVVMALVAGIGVAGFGISARTNSDDQFAQSTHITKAGKPLVITNSSTSVVR
jgi:hypothetical protein